MALENIFSLIPTIGSVVGSLLEEIFTEGKNVPMRKLTYRLGSAASLSNEIDVVNENGKLSLRNRTQDNLCVSFPAMNGNDPETIIVPSCNSLPLNDRFNVCAQNDVDTFEITALECDNALKKARFGSENVLTISAGGMVTVGNETPEYIGTYTNVLLTQSDVTITQIDGGDKGEIVNIYIQPTSSSATFVAHNAVMNDGKSVTLPHSLAIKDGEKVHVSVTINYVTSNYNEFIQKNNQKYGIRQMTNDEIRQLESMPAINQK